MAKSNAKYNGRVCVRVYLGRVDGKPKYKACYGKTQREAERKAQEVKEALHRGLNLASQNDTFEHWAKEWLKIKETEVSERWYKNLEGYVDGLSALNNLEVKKIKAADIQSLLLERARKNPKTHKPTSRRTLKGYRDTAEQILQLAIDNRVMDYNPARAVKLPAGQPKEQRRALTEVEQQWILNTPHRAKRAAMIMMYSGLRRGELIPLTWGDIDFKERTIRVNKSVEMVNGCSVLKSGAKTQAGTRTVNIPIILVDYLKEELKKEKEKGTVPVLVCPSASGKMMTENAWRRMWESYLIDLNFKYGNNIDKKGKRAKSKYNSNGIVLTIPNITAHWLRHTFATMLYLSGVDVLTARDQLGHSDIKTTLEIYTHLDQQYKKKNICKLDEYLQNKASY